MFKFTDQTLMRGFVLACLAYGPAQAQELPVLPDDLRFETFVTGLTEPLGVRHACDERLFVIQQGGQIRVIYNGTLQATPFLNINATQGGTAPPLGFSSGGERGLLGLAFDPGLPVEWPLLH